MIKRIALGSDHGGLALKNELVTFLMTQPGVSVDDKGTYTEDSVDYPDFADKVVNSIKNNENDLGILCCGTGIGISIKANRNPGIRAALIHDEFTAQMAKEHNNANIICLGGRTNTVETAKKMVLTWLNSEFEGGRHQRRVDKLG